MLPHPRKFWGKKNTLRLNLWLFLLQFANYLFKLNIATELKTCWSINGMLKTSEGLGGRIEVGKGVGTGPAGPQNLPLGKQ